MDLATMYSLANGKSGFMRSDVEIYDALNEGGFRVYSDTQKEFSGFFIKFDETSLTLLPTNATQEYTLPADCTQIVHLSERATTSENWHPMAPMDLDSALTNTQDTIGWDGFDSSLYGTDSAFGFYGPYLDGTVTPQGASLQTQKIRVSPVTDTSRFVQIVYTAKWLPITGAGSTIMLPDEGTYAMLNYAIAELNRAGDDMSRAAAYEAKADKGMTKYLAWARARQIMSPLTIEQYGPGW